MAVRHNDGVGLSRRAATAACRAPVRSPSCEQNLRCFVTGSLSGTVEAKSSSHVYRR